MSSSYYDGIGTTLLKTCRLVVLTAGTLQFTFRCSEIFAAEANRVTRPSFEYFKAKKESLQRDLALHPQDADRHNRLGLVLLELREFDKAVTEFRISRNSAPTA